MIKKQTNHLEWQIAEDEDEWAVLAMESGEDETPARKRLFTKPFLCNICLILLLVSGASGWQWYAARAKAQADLAARVGVEVRATLQDKHELVAALTDGQTPLEWKRYFSQESEFLSAAHESSALGLDGDGLLRNVDLQGEQAMTTLILTAQEGRSAYRQTRFYRRRETGGWVRTAPVAALWGQKQQLETPYFIFHFQEQDGKAVAAAAPHIDALYASMRRNLGLGAPLPAGTLPPHSAPKLAIEVNVLRIPGADSFRLHLADRFSVPSPALYLAPVGLTDAEILEQSLVFPLFDYLLEEMLVRRSVEPAWEPLLGGLRLWQLWTLDLPLAPWRKEVVQWVYADFLLKRQGEPIQLPAHYAALCAAHRLWMPQPENIQIPLLCDSAEASKYYLNWWSSRKPPIQLAQLAAPAAGPGGYYLTNQSDQMRHPGQAVALSTVIEYIVATYGHDALPALLGSIGRYNSWDTLVPAVFGVSVADFEQGWQSYLKKHYGVTLSDDISVAPVAVKP
ncbi:MAG: hypothetical protein R3C14_39690 [Caldilineaceae bacterium]